MKPIKTEKDWKNHKKLFEYSGFETNHLPENPEKYPCAVQSNIKINMGISDVYHSFYYIEDLKSMLTILKK